MNATTTLRLDAPATRASDRAALAGRLIFAAVFALALSFKLANIQGTSAYIGAVGFPAPLLLAWLAAFFEAALIVCLATGAWFRKAALAAAAYVVFLGFAFHGPSTWSHNQMEFGFFVDHFSFLAGLLFAVAHGPGRLWIVRWPRAQG